MSEQVLDTFPIEHRQAIAGEIEHHLTSEDVSLREFIDMLVAREVDRGEDPEHLFDDVVDFLSGRSMEGQGASHG